MSEIVGITLMTGGDGVDLKQHILDTVRGPNGEKPVNVTFELVKGKDDSSNEHGSR